MGQLLSSPDTEKHKVTGGDERYIYGLCEMQGWRISMEDAHATELELQGSEGNNAFFAVYDGHGGKSVANYSGVNVHKRLVKEADYWENKWESALKKAFLGTDEDIRADSQFLRDPAGCTAVAALFTHDKRIFVANAGDSRAVISVKGEVKPLSFDHKPFNESEITRIRKAGGYVEYNRVNGNLALSRALGDFEFKKNHALPAEEQIITANPDVIEHQLTDEDEFLVLACDGIWDCLTSQQVVDIVRLQISQHKELEEIADSICDLCLAPDTSSGVGVGCDNMTILIIAILNGRTKEQWYDWVTDRVKQNYGYQTPSELPQIYAPNRIAASRARSQALEERRSRERNGEEFPSGLSEFGGVFGGRGIGPSPGALSFARAIFGGAGMSFFPSSEPNDEPTVSFQDDSDEDSDEDIDPEANSRGGYDAQTILHSLGIRPPGGGGDVTSFLRAQIEELEGDDETAIDMRSEGEEKGTNINQKGTEPDEEAQQAFGTQSPHSDSAGSPNTISSSEAPPPPTPIVNGDIRVKQFSPSPGGDEAEPVVKAEGLMDTSEDPLKD